MAVVNAIKRKFANEIENLHLGVKVGANDMVGRVGVIDRASYEGLKGTDLTLARAYLQSALNKPMRAKARVTELARLYNQRFGANTFSTFISEGLTLNGSGMTVAEITADLDAMIAAATTTINSVKASTMTLDQAAAWVRTNWPHERDLWVLPDAGDYVEVSLT